jgi:pyruvate/2-oxoglutarate dehydrogenase complex dihydrolipoamide acyltransferase (E2) component
MEEGKLVKWHVREGDAVKSGDVVAEVETDKATMEVEAAEDGVIGKLLHPEGTEHVPVNHPIALLLTEDDQTEAAANSPSPLRGEDVPKPSFGAGEGGRTPIESESPSPQPSPQRGE